MKYLTVLTALVPGIAAAHGTHAPMPEPAHAISHANPVLGAVLVSVVLGVVLTKRWRA